MNLTSFALDRKTLINFLVLLVFVGGVFSFSTLGRLEDPDFTVKVGAIITQYPGASPAEVELEVTDRIERAIQEMPQLDTLYSYSRPGLSIIKVDIRPEYDSPKLPQVWDEVRKKVRDVVPAFPPGVMKPDIVDDFSFVFGFVLALTGDGYSYTEIEDYAKLLKKELSLVTGVSRVEIWGAQPKAVYLDIAETQLAALRISREDVLATLALQNMVVNSGAIEVSGQRLRVETTGQFESVEDIGDLVIRRSFADTLSTAGSEMSAYSRNISDSAPVGSLRSGSAARNTDNELIRIRDVANVRQGYLEPPLQQMRHNGKPALAIQLANVEGGNIIDTGAALDKRLEELKSLLPAGIEVSKFTWQSDLVAESINGFVVNLAEAVLIVLIV
ncbi:MAG: efflux RND transporter permease subunit, partial [Desulfobacterales bacterium]|nr:efflux RND transporter permease subunit [Desulfobacterales bacterium]